MAKILVAFGSLTSNTESIADKITAILKKRRHKVTLKNIHDVGISELLDYDVLLFGSSTWDIGHLQVDTQDFFDRFTESPVDLKKTRFAIFGCGDISYSTTFCSAVDDLEKLFTDNNGEKICEGLKIDGFPESPENIEQFDTWFEQVVI